MRIGNKGIILATAAMFLMTSQLILASTGAPSSAKPVKCFGVNSCKGKGQCGTKTKNACAGQNACKGKGWLLMSPEQCKQKGGNISNP